MSIDVQKLALAGGVLGIIAGSASQLNDIFAPFGTYAPIIVKEIVSLAAFAGGIVSFTVAYYTKQSSLVQTVAAMPGVSEIKTNPQANDTLKSLKESPAPENAKIV